MDGVDARHGGRKRHGRIGLELHRDRGDLVTRGPVDSHRHRLAAVLHELVVANRPRDLVTLDGVSHELLSAAHAEGGLRQLLGVRFADVGAVRAVSDVEGIERPQSQHGHPLRQRLLREFDSRSLSAADEGEVPGDILEADGARPVMQR